MIGIRYTPWPTHLTVERVMLDYAREHALPNGVDVPRFGIAARHAFQTWDPQRDATH